MNDYLYKLSPHIHIDNINYRNKNSLRKIITQFR